ncbi:MAG: ABC transporter permease [Acidobacteriota bacterium]
MDSLLFNLRLAVRRLLKAPQYTILILLCLALGIGANTTIFSVINTVWLKPLPIPEIDRVLTILDMRNGNDPYEAAPINYLTFEDEATSFASNGLARRTSFNLMGGDRPERIRSAIVTHDYFSTLQVEAAHGRLINAEEQQNGEEVAVLGHALWQRRFGGDTSILGSALPLDDRTYTIIGVMPPGFDLPEGSELWIPLASSVRALSLDEQMEHDYFLASRLADGVSLDSARQEVATLSRRLEETYPDTRKDWQIRAIPLRYQLLLDLEGKIPAMLSLISGVVAFLLLIACANVASLILVRAMDRSHEAAIQTALGAARHRLVGQLMTESILLALLGGAAGLGLAFAVKPWLGNIIPFNILALGDFLTRVTIDGQVLLFTFLVSLVTGVIFGLVPAIRVSMTKDLVQFLKAGGRRAGGGQSRRWLTAIVLAEVAVSAVLLTGAGLMVRSFQKYQQTDLGFEAEDRMSFEMHLSSAVYPEHAQRTAFVDQLRQRVASLPEVIAAGTSTNIPLSLASWDAAYEIESRRNTDDSDVPVTSHRMVSPGYLETIGAELIEGRLLNEQDTPESELVIVVSRDLAADAWPDESAIGKRVRQITRRGPRDWRTVVGVVSEVKEDRWNFRIDRPVWYIPYAQRPTTLPVSLVVHSQGDSNRLSQEVRAVLQEIAPNQPISSVVRLPTHLDEYFTPQRFSALLTGFFAGLGLLLTAIGLYGVMTYAVGQRSQELALRQALGATPTSLLTMVLRWGLILTALGLSAGLAASLGLTRFMQGLLFGVETTDLGTYFTVGLLLLGVAGLAALIPSLRATRVNPAEVLRQE